VRATLKNCGYDIPHTQIAKVRWLFVPEVNAREAAMVGDVEVYPVKSLVEVIHLISAGNGVSRLQVDTGQLLNQAQQVSGSIPSPLLHPRWQQSLQHISDRQRLVFSRTPHQCVGPLKPPRSQDLHFPIVVFARADDQHPPISRSVAQGVFDQNPNFSLGARITCVVEFE
jgi:hypothetical protein